MSGALYLASYPRKATFANRYFKAIYVDINILFSIDQDPVILENIDAVNVKILHLITTLPDERDFEPSFGTTITERLFAPMSARLATSTLDDLEAAMRIWLPEINLIMSKCSVTALGNNEGMFISLAYSIAGLTSDALATFSLTGS